MKPIFNPSRLRDYTDCLFRYYIKWIRNLDTLGELAHKRELGTYVHAAEEAHELGNDVRKALQLTTRRFKREPWYIPKESRVLTQLELEAYQIHVGHTFKDGKGKPHDVEGYEEWRQNNLPGAETVDVELRLRVDIGPIILAPKVDWVIGNNDGYWVVERKVTHRWDDKNWQWRWTLDGQTSLQLLVCEKHYGHPFAGVMVEPIQVTRQKLKDQPEPHPISKVERLPIKWVRKPAAVLGAVEQFLESLPGDLEQRTLRNDWPKTGMLHYGGCDFCSLKKFCKGDISIEMLQVRPPDEVNRIVKKGKDR